MVDPKQGDLILYRDAIDYNIARVDLVRVERVSSFPWLRLGSRWSKGRIRIPRTRIVEVLAADVNVVALSNRINVLANRRSAKRAVADTEFQSQIEQLPREFA